MTEAVNSESGNQDGGIVVEATWAPKDPRDKLYDEDATARERTMSLVRVIAAFHPVLNAFLLVFEMTRRQPFWTLTIGSVVAAAAFAYFAL
ncbi:hypothetical protein ACFO5Q_07565 [Kordiimonas lipolytica]|uniref:Uncharacterized protein n=1 Tax=Kordiimonas lipolytica TaxID=1662421 RepID=A0ABV8UA57_9PROT|nr:hypothetical protein [Kordiimonas lipolytica]